MSAAESTAEVQGHRALEALHRRSRFLVSASAALSESLDYGRTLRRVAELAVPDIADWCTVSAIDESGELRRLAVVHVDPARRDLVAEYQQKFPPTEHRSGHLVDVLKQGTASLSVQVTDEDLARAAQTDDHLRVMRGLGCTSCIIVPMVARGETLGVISLMRADPSCPYDEADVAIAEELAYRAALAIENARLYDEARVAVKLRDEFISIASHELKTPLTSLRLKVDGILRASAKGRPIDPDQLVARIEGVDKQLARLTELVDALLDVSRAAAGRLELNLDAVDLAKVVGDVADRFKDELASAACSLSIVVTGPDGSKGPIVGRWDRLRLDEVVTNFLSNAIKYGRSKPIQIRASASSEWALIEVEDHGMGISANDQQRLFKQFARVVSPEHTGGFGLGLWIVKVLVEAMGGKVAVKSTAGLGSVFRAELPRVRGVAEGDGA